MTTPQSILDRFPKLDDAFVEARLGRPSAKPRVIIDTDTANEIDDQYAVAWALLSPERLELEGVTAVPFSFAHHRDELIASVEALEAARDSGEKGRFMGGLGGWAQRLARSVRRCPWATPPSRGGWRVGEGDEGRCRAWCSAHGQCPWGTRHSRGAWWARTDQAVTPWTTTSPRHGRPALGACCSAS